MPFAILTLLLITAHVSQVVCVAPMRFSAERFFDGLARTVRQERPEMGATAGSSSDANPPVWPPESIGTNVADEYGLAPRAYFYSACADIYCDVFGGFGTSKLPSSDFFEMTQSYFEPGAPVSNSQMFNRVNPPSPPTPRCGGKMVMLFSPILNESLSFVFGGTVGGSESGLVDSAYLYSYQREQWYQVFPPVQITDNPPPITLFSMVSMGGENFTIFFGATALTGLSNTVVEGSVDTSTTTMRSFSVIKATAVDDATGHVTLLPRERVSACCVANPSAKKTMCFGGQNGVKFLNDTWVYDHSKQLWHDVTAYSLQRQGATISVRMDSQCTLLKSMNSALLYGGIITTAFAPTTDTKVYRFSFDTMTWSVFLSNESSVIPARGAGAMFVTNEQSIPTIEIFGGVGVTGILGDRWIYTMNWLAAVPLPPGTQQPATFVLVEADAIVPESRKHHSAVKVGAGMLVGFGVSAIIHSSVYYYYQNSSSPTGQPNVTDQWLWVLVSTTSAQQPSPRFGASVCAQGSVAYFFGGFLSVDRSTMTNELWSLTLDMESLTSRSLNGSWRLMQSIAPTNGATTFVMQPHAFHGSFITDSRIVVVGGFVASSSSLSGALFAFDLRLQQWIPVTLYPVQLIPRAGFGLYFNGSHVLITGGETIGPTGRTVLGDLVIISAPRNPIDKFIHPGEMGVGVTTLVSKLTQGILPFPAKRAYAATAGSGNNIFICGGAVFISALVELGAPLNAQCMLLFVYENIGIMSYYPMTRTNSYGVVVEGGGLGSTGVLIGSSLLIFGGSLVEKQVQRQEVYSDAMQHFELNDILCSWQQWSEAVAMAVPAPCLPCGRGSVNNNVSSDYETPYCILAPAGYYSPDPLSTNPCPAGRSSSIAGLGGVDSCMLCAPGTYAPNPGMTSCLPCPNGSYCPLGAAHPQNSTISNSSFDQTQPEPMADGSTPAVIFIAAGCFCFVMLIGLGVLSYLSRAFRLQRRAYFFNEEAIMQLRAVYQLRKRAHFGLDKFSLEAALHDLGIVHLHRDFVTRLLAEFDQDGSCHLTFTAFQEVVISFIERGLLKPFPQTGEALNPGKGLSTLRKKIIKFDLKALDSYDTEHSLGIEGESIRIHSTISGGVTRVVFNILALAVALALTGQFVYTNTVETRATIPSVNFEHSISALWFDVSVTAIGGATTMSDCVANASYDPSTSLFKGVCATGTGVNLMTLTNAASGVPSVYCLYNYDERSCTVHLHCADCSFAFGANVGIEFSFGGEIYASSLVVSIASDSGIRRATSSVSTALAPSDFRLVFRGYPATAVSAYLLPTLFETVDNLIFQNTVNETGYHVQTGNANIVAGQVIPADQATQYYGVPVVVTLDTGNSVLNVKQLPKNTLLDFISQMLGSITGMGGILVTLMQMYDSKFISKRHEKLREELEDKALDEAPEYEEMGSVPLNMIHH